MLGSIFIQNNNVVVIQDEQLTGDEAGQ